MAIQPGKSSKLTFSSMSEDFVESRFDPEYKNVFLQEHLDAFQDTPATKRYDIPIFFSGSFDKKSRKAIENLVNAVLHNAEFYNLKLEHSTPAIRFYDAAAWKLSFAPYGEHKLSLPAAKLKKDEQGIEVQLIIPGQLSNGEAVIKTVRLLCAKLFGQLFFDEIVMRKAPFHSIRAVKEEKTVELKEKVHFCRLLDNFPRDIINEFKRLGKQQGRGIKDLEEAGKKQFFQILLEQQEQAPQEHLNHLCYLYDLNMADARENTDGFFLRLVDRIFDLLPQSSIILPHERRNFDYLKEGQLKALFSALTDRLQFISRALQDLYDCWDYLSKAGPENPLDYNTSGAWIKNLGDLKTQLLKRGVIKLFLIEGAILSEKQQQQLNQFPLWIWRHRLMDYFPPDAKPQKVIDRITNQYRHSVYHKLFELTCRLITDIRVMEKDERIKFTELADRVKLKTAKTWLDLRKDSLMDLLHTCRLGYQLCEETAVDQYQLENKAKIYEKGWSYFISFALLHQYFLNRENSIGGNSEKAGRFQNVIESYVKDRIKKRPSYRLSYLLLKVYQKNQFDVSGLVEMLSESKILDFFVLNQRSILKREHQDVESAIEKYSDSILKWIEQHHLNQVSTDDWETSFSR